MAYRNRTSIARRSRHARAPLLVGTLALASSLALAQSGGFQYSGNVIGDEVMYSIGGGNAVSMSGAAGMRSIGVGVGWNSNLICGDMSISTTIQNQLNGLTNGFQNIMSSVIQNATSAVASLPALVIQRADPGLYNLLTNGVLQARMDFDRSKLTCRAMAQKMADVAGGQLGWSQLAEGMALRNAVASTDAVSAVDQAEKSRGNQGVPWVGGGNAGGAGQAPIRVVSDVTKAGYNLVNGRSVADTSSIASSNCASLSCKTWSSPQAAANWATRVLGEQEQRTCASCTKTQTVPGVGLTPLIQEEYETKLKALQTLISGSRKTTVQNLNEAGSASLPITRGVIEALREEPDQDVLAHRLACRTQGLNREHCHVENLVQPPTIRPTRPALVQAWRAADAVGAHGSGTGRHLVARAPMDLGRTPASWKPDRARPCRATGHPAAGMGAASAPTRATAGGRTQAR